MSEGGAQGCQDVSWGGGVPISGGEGPADRHGGAATLNQDCGSAKKIFWDRPSGNEFYNHS